VSEWNRVCGLMLEAQAANIRQHHLLFDPSPEPDSVIELALLGDGRRAARLAVEALRHNRRERVLQRRAARIADRHHRAGRPVGARSAATLLRPHLRALAKAERAGLDVRELAVAVGAVRPVGARMRRGTVWSRTLDRELGTGRARLARTVLEAAPCRA